MGHRTYMGAGLFLACSVMAADLRAEGAVEALPWNYEEQGPDRWADIDPAYAACSAGRHQSPIDIPEEAEPAETAIAFDYEAGAAGIVNLGHTLQVNVAPGNALVFDGTRYSLLQFHFHTPSENTIGGDPFPLEVHLVHRSDAGALAVVSVLMEAGEAGLVDGLPLPAEIGGEEDIAAPLDPAALLPASRGFYAFQGSLTTPPCSEGVQWIVMKDQATAGEAVLARIAAMLGPTNRPVNPLNGRAVLSVR